MSARFGRASHVRPASPVVEILGPDVSCQCEASVALNRLLPYGSSKPAGPCRRVHVRPSSPVISKNGSYCASRTWVPAHATAPPGVATTRKTLPPAEWTARQVTPPSEVSSTLLPSVDQPISGLENEIGPSS